MKPKYHIIISVFALACLLSLAYAKKAETSRIIRWGERQLVWDDFPIIRNIPGDYHAMVYSDIQFEGNRDDNFLRIYARMVPTRSGRISFDVLDSDQLLIHEQNHFNITEYHARLFRKEVIAIGKAKLTNDDLQNLGKKYLAKIDRMQNLYDSESDHNTIWPKQRYWELYIAGLLRETSHYSEEDIYKYQEFSGGDTKWFRQIYVTSDGQVLTSYPENKRNSRYGEAYKVERKNDSIIVSFYKNGKNQAGGYFEAPLCIITSPDANTQEQHFLDENGNYFPENNSPAIYRTEVDQEGNTIRTYYDGNRKQISNKGIFVRKGNWIGEENSFYLSYYDEAGRQISQDGAYNELWELDESKRIIGVSYFDRAGKPMRDENQVSKYEYERNSQHLVTRVKYFDVDGKPAMHKDGYHLIYEHNERGNVSAIAFFDVRGNKAADENGIHKYTYSYDLYDNNTDIRKFNIRDLASNGINEFHHSVNLFDSLGRITFAAQYHPGYILKFSEEKDGATVYEYVGDSIVKLKNVDVYGTESDNDSGISLAKQILNSKKEVVGKELYKSDGFWAKTPKGETSYSYKYDERGNQIEMAAFDSLGKLIAWDEDVAISRWKYDDRNNKISTTYFTVENELADAAQGIAYNEFTYDENNVLLEMAYFDKDKKPGLFDGVHRTTSLANRFGKDSILRKYDTNNLLLKDSGIIKYIYSEYGILESEAYFDDRDRPMLDETGIHKRVYNHDKNWRYTGVSYKGKYGEAVNDYQGVSHIVINLTTSGFMGTISYYDKNKNPVVGSEGYHSIRNHYNDMDECQRISFYGVNNELVNNEDGIADYVFGLNDKGQITRISYYDADSNLTEDSDGVAVYYYEESLNGLFYLEQQLNALGEEVGEM